MKKVKKKNYKVLPPEPQKTYTKGDYVRLGDRLRTYEGQFEIPLEDLKILQTLRTSYKEPLSEVFDILQKSIEKINKRAIITYRVKRINSIISKLKRLDKAQLPRIEDIAGCRCILKNNDEVYALKEILSKELYIKSDRNDYIAAPKVDGYRSLHLIVQTLDRTSNPIEIQLRCEDDHNWATLVEITDQIYDTKIKELGNNQKLGRLLYLLSKGFMNLNKSELNEIIEIIIAKKFVRKLSSVFMANSVNVIKRWSEIDKFNDRSFYLIRVDENNNSHIQSYSNFLIAEKEYFNNYQQYPNDNIVLTHIRDAQFEQISKAYSNYTLTYHGFIGDLLANIKELANKSIEHNSIRDFNKYFTLFTEVYFEIAKLQITEAFILRKTECKRNKKREWETALKRRSDEISKKGKELFHGIETNKFNPIHFIIDLKKKSIWKKNVEKFLSELTDELKEVEV